MTAVRYGGIEAGGTKFVCVVGSGPQDVVAHERIATTSPAETLERVVHFFRAAEAEHGPCAALGVAAFGPLDLDPASPTYGRLTETPKPHWSGVDLLAPLRAELGRPIALGTDVQGAGLAEWLWGAGRGSRTLCYVTVGTGIGGSVLRDGTPLDPVLHPEMGHLRLPRHPADGAFPGVCAIHGDCLEGLASGPAVLARWGKPLESLPPDHPAWGILGFYLGHLCAALSLVVAPHRIVFGGGLMSSGGLLAPISRATESVLAGYPRRALLASGLEGYVRPAALGERAGSMGALALAARAAATATNGFEQEERPRDSGAS